MCGLPLLISVAALTYQAAELAPPPPPTKPVVTSADAWLRKLEQETQSTRDEVRRQLADAATIPAAAADQAKLAWANATKAKEAAVSAVVEYTEGKLLQETVEAKGAIEIAQADLTRAQEQLAFRQKLVDGGQEVAGPLYWSTKLAADRAGFELEIAETELQVLQRYNGPKETKRLQALVEAAADDEQIKKQEYDTQLMRLKQRQAASTRLQARTPEDLVVAILDDVMKHEGRIIDLTRELTAIQAEQAADPNRATTAFDRIKANRDAIANTTRQIKEDLTLATTVAEEARQARDRLFLAEKRLIVARRQVDAAPK